MNVDSPLFVIGTQRSGTTLLCRMLSSHPELYIQNELNVRRIFSRSGSENIFRMIKELILEDQGQSIEKLLSESGKLYWGLKDPELTAYIEELKAFLPQSKFIVIVRDPRAVVNSYIKNRWGLGTNAYTGARRWCEEVSAQHKFLLEFPGSVYLLQYESLVKNAEKEIVSICDFLELDFDEHMLSYDENQAFYKKNRENSETFSKLNVGNIEKWASQLTTKEQQIVESECCELMRMFGYRPKSGKIRLSRLEIAYYNLHQRIIGELQLQYRWRVASFKKKFLR